LAMFKPGREKARLNAACLTLEKKGIGRLRNVVRVEEAVYRKR